MSLASPLQVSPAALPVSSFDAAHGRIAYLAGGIPSIEQILRQQPMAGDHGGDDADRLLAALRQDNLSFERMLEQLAALACAR